MQERRRQEAPIPPRQRLYIDRAEAARAPILGKQSLSAELGIIRPKDEVYRMGAAYLIQNWVPWKSGSGIVEIVTSIPGLTDLKTCTRSMSVVILYRSEPSSLLGIRIFKDRSFRLGCSGSITAPDESDASSRYCSIENCFHSASNWLCVRLKIDSRLPGSRSRRWRASQLYRVTIKSIRV